MRLLSNNNWWVVVTVNWWVVNKEDCYWKILKNFFLLFNFSFFLVFLPPRTKADGKFRAERVSRKFSLSMWACKSARSSAQVDWLGHEWIRRGLQVFWSCHRHENCRRWNARKCVSLALTTARKYWTSNYLLIETDQSCLPIAKKIPFTRIRINHASSVVTLKKKRSKCRAMKPEGNGEERIR